MTIDLMTTASSVGADKIIEADRRHVVHGFSRLGVDLEPGPIFRTARGIHLTDVEGNDWLDGCAGLANMSLGYGRDQLADVARDAMRELSFGTTFYHRRGHVYGALLAARLAEKLPQGLDHIYYALGGSDAVETAIKFARYVFAAEGRPEKHHVIGRVRSYHGITYGGLSLAGDTSMSRGVGPLLAGFSHIEQPTADQVDSASALEAEILRVGPENVAAFMAEPISTPNGIVVPPQDYWPRVREICTKYDVLLIADEVLTGFGRTGEMFGMDNWNVVPDLMTMSKAITAGYFPLSAVALTRGVLERMSADPHDFAGGVTNGGHAVGCAVALAVLDIMDDEQVVAGAAATGEYLREQLRSVGERHPSLNPSSVRGLGMMGALDVDASAVDREFGRQMHAAFVQQRLFVRSYLDQQTLACLPSLTCSRADIDQIIERIDLAVSVVESRA